MTNFYVLYSRRFDVKCPKPKAKFMPKVSLQGTREECKTKERNIVLPLSC